MPRLSATGTFLEGTASDALEWVRGDTRSLQGTVYSDEDQTEPQDLTGTTLELIVETYTATVSSSAGRQGSTLNVSNLSKVEDVPAVTLDCIVDVDQEANRGELSVLIPADIATNPDADITSNVPVLVCYLKKTTGIDVSQERFLIVVRRGAPDA